MSSERLSDYLQQLLYFYLIYSVSFLTAGHRNLPASPRTLAASGPGLVPPLLGDLSLSVCSLQVKSLGFALSAPAAAAALHMGWSGHAGVFNLVFSVSPPARTASNKLFMRCHVKERLQHPPAGTGTVRVLEECVSVSCILCKRVCVCCNTHSKSKS